MCVDNPMADPAAIERYYRETELPFTDDLDYDEEDDDIYG